MNSINVGGKKGTKRMPERAKEGSTCEISKHLVDHGGGGGGANTHVYNCIHMYACISSFLLRVCLSVSFFLSWGRGGEPPGCAPAPVFGVPLSVKLGRQGQAWRLNSVLPQSLRVLSSPPPPPRAIPFRFSPWLVPSSLRTAGAFQKLSEARSATTTLWAPYTIS